MHIRCRSCHNSLWVEPEDKAGAPREFRCTQCAQRYCIKSPGRLRNQKKRLAKEARKLAETCGIDMPGAYSVLLKILTVQEVHELGHSGPSVHKGDKSSAPAQSDKSLAQAPSDRSTATAQSDKGPVQAPSDRSPAPAQSDKSPAQAFSGKSLGYDKSFQPAIDAGLLTPHAAALRGQRDVYAGNIAHRFQIPLEAAYAVADNRDSLLNQLRARNTAERSDDPVIIEPGEKRRRGLWLGVGSAAVLAVVMTVRQSLPEIVPEEMRNRTVLGAHVQTDHRGRVMRVAASNPRAVLTAYCASQTRRTMEAVDVVPSARHGADVRLGLLQQTGDSNGMFMIQIVEDRAAREWVAGDGTTLIQLQKAPREAAVAKGSPPPSQSR